MITKSGFWTGAPVKSPTMKNVTAWAKKKNAELKADAFDQSVSVMHNHGDFFYVNHSACVCSFGGSAGFHVVFTEHDGYRVYSKEDVRMRVKR